MEKYAFLLIFLISINLFSNSDCKALLEKDGNLWIANEEGKFLKQLTFNGKGILDAKWSPDGQYIAYSLGGGVYADEDNLLIIDIKGNLLNKILVDLSGIYRNIDYIDKIIWDEKGILITNGVVGRYGMVLSIFELNEDLSNYKNIKNIFALNCGDYVLSKDLKVLACLNPYDEENYYLEIHYIEKHFNEESNTWDDPKPRKIKLENVEINFPLKLEFSKSLESVFIIEGERKYEIDISKTCKTVEKNLTQEEKQKVLTPADLEMFDKKNIKPIDLQLKKIYELCTIKKVDEKLEKREEMPMYIEIKGGGRKFKNEKYFIYDWHCKQKD